MSGTWAGHSMLARIRKYAGLSEACVVEEIWDAQDAFVGVRTSIASQCIWGFVILSKLGMVVHVCRVL